jgi:hypothetical protein
MKLLFSILLKSSLNSSYITFQRLFNNQHFKTVYLKELMFLQHKLAMQPMAINSNSKSWDWAFLVGEY